MQAHMAPLGMRFYRGKQFPANYRDCILLATHGSWNRSSPVGYNLMLARPDAAGMVRAEMFDLLFRRPSSPSILLLAQLRDAFRLGAFFAELLGFEEFG